jgi:hypothetical protein
MVFVMTDPPIPEPSEEQKREWAKKIIEIIDERKFYSLETVVNAIQNYFETQFPKYRIDTIGLEKGDECLVVRKAPPPGSDPMDDLFAAFKPDKEPPTEDVLMMQKYVRTCYLKILDLLEMDNPAKYSEIITKIGLRPFEKIPDFREQAFEFWSKKIIDYYKIKNDTPMEKIIKSIARFFNLLFQDYSFTYFVPKTKEYYPIAIDRKYESSGMYFMEIDKMRLMIYNINYIILKKLKRFNDYSKDPNYWFDLVRMFEEMGLGKKADEFGAHGLSLDPKELGGLTDLVTLYIEKKQFMRGMKYIKKSALIMKEKKMLQPALVTWKKIAEFEPHDKSHWLVIADIYEEMGNSLEAAVSRKKAEM